MKNNKIKKVELLNELNLLSDEKIEELKEYVENMLFSEKISLSSKKSLKGIWENIGFEKIKNLEDEVTQIRKQSSTSILNKNI